MPDQDSDAIAETPAVETNVEGPSEEWLTLHRTTAEEQENARWFEARNKDAVADKAFQQALGHDYKGYQAQLEALSSDDRLYLADKSAEDIAAYLDENAEAERDQKKREHDLEEQRREQAETNFRAREAPGLHEVRKAMKTAYQQATSLDERIEELQRLNELRDDPTAKGWDGLSADQWRAAREGKQESLDSEISNLIQEKQARLQEAALHQSAYFEGAQQNQASNGYSMPDRPIGQIVGNDGQPMQLTQGDLATYVQLERDDQAHKERLMEAEKRYPDLQQVGRNATAAGADVTAQQAAFIKSLPNSADVAYYLCSHPDETIELARMPGHAATRALINISHKVARPSAQDAPRTTNAPKPPSPVSGSSRGGFDVYDDSGDADSWFRRRNADLERRGKL